MLDKQALKECLGQQIISRRPFLIPQGVVGAEYSIKVPMWDVMEVPVTGKLDALISQVFDMEEKVVEGSTEVLGLDLVEVSWKKLDELHARAEIRIGYRMVG